jgi:SAM-dependent methyltransferase
VTDFDELVTEGLTAPFFGWDFSWLARHSSTGPAPWDYRARVADLARTAETMLDMGTGGGEVLSRLRARAPRTVATEGWPPNVPVAGERLRPLGVPVVQDKGARNNTEQDGTGEDGTGEDGTLPFRDGAFQLICNRHESFRAAEVCRVLEPGGRFITQQVDFHSYDELVRVLGIDIPPQPDTWLGIAQRQLTNAGLVIEESAAGEERIRFNDIAGIVYYLRIVNWAIPGYSLEAYREKLRALFDDDTAWPVMASQRQFMLVAVKPG